MLSFMNAGVFNPGLTGEFMGPYDNDDYNVNSIVGMAVPSDGTLHHFVITSKANSLSVPTAFTVFVNGISSTLVLILPGGDTKELNAAENLDVDAGDVISVAFSIPAGTGQLISPSVNCLFSPT